MTPLTRQQVADSLRRLPPLPAVATEVLASLEDDDAVCIRNVSARIGRDPAIAARLLRVANSPFYGRPGRVASIEDATLVLGTQAVKSLVTAACLIQVLRIEEITGFSQRSFWQHSIATAVIARNLAPLAGAHPATAFAGGLLHDVGRIALIAGFPERYREVLRDLEGSTSLPIEIERDHLGVDHAEAGALLAAQWRFAPSLATAIAGHHPGDGGSGDSGADLIHVADVIAHALGWNAIYGEQVPPPSLAAWARLNLAWEDLGERFATLESQYEAAASLLPS